MPREFRSQLSSLAVASVVLVTAGCDIFSPDAREQRRDALEYNQSRWASQSIEAYRFVSDRACECAPGFTGPVEIVVSDGEITDVTPLAGQDSVPREEWAGGFATVEDLFEHIERALDEGAHELEVRYDPSLGYPTQIWIDFDQQMVDEEISIQASDLEVIESQ